MWYFAEKYFILMHRVMSLKTEKNLRRETYVSKCTESLFPLRLKSRDGLLAVKRLISIQTYASFCRRNLYVP